MLEQAHECVREHFVGTVANEYLLWRDVEFRMHGVTACMGSSLALPHLPFLLGADSPADG